MSVSHAPQPCSSGTGESGSEDDQGEAALTELVAGSFQQLADAALGREDFAAANDFYRKSLTSNEQAGNREEMAVDYLHLGNVAVKAGVTTTRRAGIAKHSEYGKVATIFTTRRLLLPPWVPRRPAVAHGTRPNTTSAGQSLSRDDWDHLPC